MRSCWAIFLLRPLSSAQLTLWPPAPKPPTPKAAFLPRSAQLALTPDCHVTVSTPTDSMKSSGHTRLDVIAGLDTLRNLALFPFDLSFIQALAITHISFKAHAILSTMPLQILMLDLTQGGVENLDLSLLPHLTTLRICFGPRFFTSSITTLATIVSSQRIHTIALSFMEVLHTTALMELDLALSSLPLSPPPIVEVIRSRDRMNFKVSEFPILSSKNMLRVCPNGSLDFWTGERVWWQGVIEKL
ncbi:hypothetical protein R3P38DRAFT_466855 [Favolaschia claudopus]|uniref:Uncharacterized protein n=1 Tax=Favolaschia claudopus TaxID=2862362 RepID=A0AAV9ZE13_9AGAR